MLTLGALGLVLALSCGRGEAPTPTVIPEADREARREIYQKPAVDVFGTTQPYSQAELLRKDAYFTAFDNPLQVNPECVREGAIKYNEWHENNIGIEPRFEGDKLAGFVVWPERVGVGYTGMNEDIKRIEENCKK